jgi:hypothetical protein
MSQKAYLVNLSGQGDYYTFLVDKDTFDWILCNKKTGRNGHSWIDKDVPLAIESRIVAETGNEITVTSGSLDNDRAIHAMAAPMIVSGEISPVLFSQEKITAYIKKNALEIVDEFDGCIY